MTDADPIICPVFASLFLVVRYCFASVFEVLFNMFEVLFLFDLGLNIIAFPLLISSGDCPAVTELAECFPFACMTLCDFLQTLRPFPHMGSKCLRIMFLVCCLSDICEEELELSVRLPHRELSVHCGEGYGRM